MSRAGVSRPQLAVALSHVEPMVGPHLERLLELARAAEDAGIDQVVLSEHVTLAHVITGHPGSSGHFPFPGDEQYPEPLVTLAAIAAVTSRVRLSTNILIAPLRPAVLLAKMAATVDCLSGGRLELGVGTGWHEEEYAALGVPMEGRVARLDDTLRACKAMWRNRPASFSSATVSFQDMYCSPGPVHDDIPLWIGGSTTRGMARRVVELGTGWSPMGGNNPAEVAEGRALIAQACAEAGRDPASVGVRVSIFPPRDATPANRVARMLESVPALLEAGVTVIQVPAPQLAGSVDEAREVLAEVVSAVDELAATTAG
ncbi:MAG TPA: TIGR03619 family F420-dependent LLM class oxidoreductase [Candidatus Dormibacteraeota bacterium]|jgi:probable F420-dependent oxidoreductase|nr:TIGR03619 family F420-dependent LLM class oxidoreductase [Candidatus Dormibacteraeota bacterium]